MDIKQMQYFLSVAEAGSFSAAAEKLYISQPSLSKQIIALENELELQLFDRSKRKISITPAGKILYKHAVRQNQIHKTMLAELKEYKKTAPSLSIAAIPVIAQYGITSLIAKFKSTYPNINLSLEELETSNVLPALNKHEYDLAFVRDYDVDRKQYSFIEMIGDKLMAAVSKNHRFADRKSISLSELANENFITYNPGTVIYKLSVNACKAAGFEPKTYYSTLRGASIMGMVASNSGVALMMEKVLNYYHRSDVVAIPLNEIIESKIILAYPKKGKFSKPARVFVDFMKKQVRS